MSDIRGQIRVEALGSIEAVAAFREQMDSLNLRSRRPCPFSTFEFLATFTDHDESASPEDEFLFLGGFRGEKMAGFMALRRRTQRLLRFSFKKIEWLTLNDGDRPHVVASPEDEGSCCSAFYRFLLGHDRRWSLLELSGQDAESGLQAVPAERSRLYYVRRFENPPNVTIPLPHASIANYFTSLEHNVRKSVARRGRRLLEAGAVELVSSSDPRARGKLLDVYLDIERRSWKGAARVGLARDPKRMELFRSLCRPDQPLAIHFDLMLLDGVPIAGQVSGAFQGAAYALETSYDAAYADLSPGNLLHMLFIRQVIQRRLRSCNLLHDFAYYKTAWNGVAVPTRALQIFRVPSLPYGRARMGEIRRWIKGGTAGSDPFNPVKRNVEAKEDPGAESRPPRCNEARNAAAYLAEAAASGARIDRLSGPDLRAALPFDSGAKPNRVRKVV